MEDVAIAVVVLSIAMLVIAWLYRRFRRAVPDVPPICHAAAAIALTFGVGNMITGTAHSVAVTSLAFGEPEYGPLQILRFTTGAMLVYSGAMAAALYRSIKMGRRSAIVLALGSAVLFEMYLLFLYPLPGTGDTVPPVLGLWTLYLISLSAAGAASSRETVAAA